MKSKNPVIILGTFVMAGLIGWYFLARSSGIGSSEQSSETMTLGSSEQSIVLIPLEGPITGKKAELSGLAWMGDTLVLLPQYPEKFGPNDGALFTIPKQAILDYLDGKSQQPISPNTIELIAPGLKDSIPKFEGYEAIGFLNQNVYLTIESGKDNEMMGYLVSGTVSSDSDAIRIDTSHVAEIQPPIQMDNRTDEALVITQNKILTFFEVNGANLNPQPAAHVFDLNLTPEGTILFPHLEYLVTDAALGPDGEIWILNQASPNDSELFSIFDPLKEFRKVERLVKLNHETSGITLADTPPLQIKLDKDPRNWEGLVLLDNRGFLLVTDKSPDTLLGFVPVPK